jgi:hypothetical protein
MVERDEVSVSAASVVRLADQDNESDEYHVKVPLLDTWASYAALADAGWTQERRGQLPS